MKISCVCFSGCVISENPSPPDSPHSNYTVTFRSGLSLRVASRNGVLYLITAASSDFRSNTSGLLGAWGDDVTDMRTNKGDSFNMSGGAESLHDEFGMSCE